jgi:hypothetical protein
MSSSVFGAETVLLNARSGVYSLAEWAWAMGTKEACVVEKNDLAGAFTVESQREAGKAVYCAPKLTVVGTVETLTQAAGNVGAFDGSIFTQGGG